MTGAFGFMHIASNATDTREAVSQLSFVTVVVASLVLLIPPLLVPKRSGYTGRGGAGPIQTLRGVWSREGGVSPVSRFVDIA
jgi:hypothetical protein